MQVAAERPVPERWR